MHLLVRYSSQLLVKGSEGMFFQSNESAISFLLPYLHPTGHETQNKQQ